MGRRGFVGTAGVVAAVLLGAAGCGGDPEPRFAPPSDQASPSAPASPSPSESAAPERLSREETVRSWVEARNAALQDGDTSAMSVLYARDCEGCDLMNAAITDVYEAGGYYDTPGWTVESIATVSDAETDLRVTAAAGRAQASADAAVVEFPRAMRDIRFSFKEVSNQLLISNIAVLAGS